MSLRRAQSERSRATMLAALSMPAVASGSEACANAALPLPSAPDAAEPQQTTLPETATAQVVEM